jgi:hypothetical protein
VDTTPPGMRTERTEVSNGHEDPEVLLAAAAAAAAVACLEHVKS